MEYATIYEKTNLTGRNAAKFYLDQYAPRLNWNENEKIIDIGCGGGGVTLDILLPKLQQNFLNLYGIDISEEAVSIAKQKTDDPRINFSVFDISSATLPESLVNSVDRVFSFYCLHWVYKQR